MVFLLALSLIAALDEPTGPLIDVPGSDPFLEALSKLPKSAARVRLRVRDPDEIAALVGRCPNLVQLVLIYPGNRMTDEQFLPLLRLEKLRQFELNSDLFLTDVMFSAIGRLKSLRSLRLCLP